MFLAKFVKNIGCEYACSIRGEASGNGGADAASGAGDYRQLAVEAAGVRLIFDRKGAAGILRRDAGADFADDPPMGRQEGADDKDGRAAPGSVRRSPD